MWQGWHNSLGFLPAYHRVARGSPLAEGTIASPRRARRIRRAFAAIGALYTGALVGRSDARAGPLNNPAAAMPARKIFCTVAS